MVVGLFVHDWESKLDVCPEVDLSLRNGDAIIWRISLTIARARSCDIFLNREELVSVEA